MYLDGGDYCFNDDDDDDHSIHHGLSQDNPSTKIAMTQVFLKALFFVMRMTVMMMRMTNMMMVTLTFAERADDFCFFLSLAANEVDDTVGFEADEVLTDVLNLVKCRDMNVGVGRDTIGHFGFEGNNSLNLVNLSFPMYRLWIQYQNRQIMLLMANTV